MKIPQKYHKWILLTLGIYFVISAVISAYVCVIKKNGHKVKIPNDVSFKSIVSLEECARNYAEKYYDGDWKLVWITVGYDKTDNLNGNMRAHFYYYDEGEEHNWDDGYTCTVSMNSETNVMQVRKSENLNKGSLAIDVSKWKIDLDDIIEFDEFGFDWNHFSFGAYVDEYHLSQTVHIDFSGENDTAHFYFNPTHESMIES